MTFEEFLNLFDNPKEQRGQFMVQCPAHEDRIYSLAVKDGQDRILLKCFAGCPTGYVLEELGITWRDLFYQEEYVPTQNPEAYYHYQDERGEVVYTKIRFPGKKFVWKTGNGWGLDGVRRVLYDLPYLIGSLRDGNEVWVVEGEKDCDSLSQVGVVATTAGGVNDWSPQFPRYFIGARVVIVADKDEPGRKAANEIGESLWGIAESVRIVEPKVGNDITDHLEAGHKLEEVIECKTLKKEDFLKF